MCHDMVDPSSLGNWRVYLQVTRFQIREDCGWSSRKVQTMCGHVGFGPQFRPTYCVAINVMESYSTINWKLVNPNIF